MHIVPKESNVEEFRELMHQRVDRLCDSYIGYEANNKNLALMAMTIIGMDASYNTTAHFSDNAPYGRVLLPAIISEIFRSENIREISNEIFRGTL